MNKKEIADKIYAKLCSALDTWYGTEGSYKPCEELADELVIQMQAPVKPEIAEELLKYLGGVITIRKNGYTDNYREMLMKDAHLEAFENIRGWILNKQSKQFSV